jgi:hypothetical protein
MKSGNPNFLEPSGPLQAYNGAALSSFIMKHQKRRNHSNIYTRHTETDHFRAPKPVTIYLGALSSVPTVRTGLNNLGYIQLHTYMQELWERVQNFIGSLFSLTKYTFPDAILPPLKEW